MIGSRREILVRKVLVWIALLLGACFRWPASGMDGFFVVQV